MIIISVLLKYLSLTVNFLYFYQSKVLLYGKILKSTLNFCFPGTQESGGDRFEASVQVEETNDLPKLIRISNVRLRRNENFDGDLK